MKLKINRLSTATNDFKTFEFTVSQENLLKALEEIKTNDDPTLTYRCGCKSGVCGSCTVRVNGVEKLACRTNIKEGDLVEPLKNSRVIKDLVVDVSHETLLIKKTNIGIKESASKNISQADVLKIDTQSNCILCNACYSSCPVYEVNKEFLGPFALTKALRYENDLKSQDEEIINSVQANGIWDCTLCSACTFVCPQGIDPKMDIMQLQNISSQKGYTNPYMNNFDNSMGFDSFDSNDFGFNPNGGF
ncbi:succinate dehydrogenase/fumarate reductase iron-sulfur subunit [Arcobacter roscoffensis]|uniref:Fumarate reductase iron-sulfur subunit n=1 Tax=Arcobacter roscoffensis TaxID=2961520 RepID=A0ABY5E4X2_9BACT|nr:2Fe-2S iron-sulfur cluster-binding protein [Arcobacter roscoffensis]UTJ06597.1 2Fe-2S iron-sulfur cluster-binding protein [Arcobacter roscoffensis]